MPDQMPNDAPDIPTDARDEATAKTIVPNIETRPGGGGLGGASAAEAAHGASEPGGATPNAPIDVPVPHDTSDTDAPNDAAREAGDRAPEPRPGSQ